MDLLGINKTADEAIDRATKTINEAIAQAGGLADKETAAVSAILTQVLQEYVPAVLTKAVAAASAVENPLLERVDKLTALLDKLVNQGLVVGPIPIALGPEK